VFARDRVKPMRLQDLRLGDFLSPGGNSNREKLLADDDHGLAVQRRRDRLPCLRLIGVKWTGKCGHSYCLTISPAMSTTGFVPLFSSQCVTSFPTATLSPLGMLLGRTAFAVFRKRPATLVTPGWPSRPGSRPGVRVSELIPFGHPVIA
jgi:hypothetical protein